VPITHQAFTCADEAKAEPFWHSHRFHISNWAFYETWNYNLRLNRIGDLITDSENAISIGRNLRDYIRDYLESELEISSRGEVTCNSGKKIKVCKILDQYESFWRDVPAYITDMATTGKAKLTSGYSAAAAAMMRSMGWDGQSGLGPRGQGIVSPVKAASGYRHRAGLRDRAAPGLALPSGFPKPLESSAL
jgi:hypothetical protein